jgi:hypothetical protein
MWWEKYITTKHKKGEVLLKDLGIFLDLFKCFVHMGTRKKPED